MLHYDAILFDVDGTLIDSAPGILNTLEEVFKAMGVDVARSDLNRYIGPPLRKSFGEHFRTLPRSRRPPSATARVMPSRAAMREMLTPAWWRCWAASRPQG